MGFDKNDDRPIIEPKKKTTKVNILMAVGVLIFFVFCGAAIAWFKTTKG